MHACHGNYPQSTGGIDARLQRLYGPERRVDQQKTDR